MELQGVPSLCAEYRVTCVASRSLRSTLLAAELERLLLDALQVEQVVEERGQPARLGPDDLEIAPRLLRREVPLEHQRGEAEHAGERRPQLVRHVADELALHPLALDERPVSLLEIGDGAFE